jgi:hypothetical protein
MPTPERIAELEARLAEWEQLPKEARGDPARYEGRSAFDRRGPHSWKGPLTGADVFYLAARTLAGSVEPDALAAAATRLRTSDLEERLDFDLTALNLVGADLTNAHLEHAILSFSDLRGVDLADAHLSRVTKVFGLNSGS